MAEDKSSFLLYADYYHTVKKLSKEKAGELFLTILAYVNDENPVVEDVMVDLVFEPIKLQLKRDLAKWSGKKVVKSENGALGNLKRWNNDLYLQVVENKITLETAQIIAKDRKTSLSDNSESQSIAPVANIAVTVNDNVNGNVTVTDTVTVKNKRANALVVGKPTTEVSVKELKSEYDELVKSLTGSDLKNVITGLKEFIHDKKPPFIEPYQEYWNLFAGAYSLPKVEVINEDRRKKFKTRINEPPFDFVKIMEKIKFSNTLKGVDTNSSWKVTFDWVFENQKNYVKVLEGNYNGN